MSESIVTYQSANARPGQEWVAYVDLGHDYLGVRFSGSTEAAAHQKASEFWEASRAEREETRARIEAGRAKAAATRSAKSDGSSLSLSSNAKPLKETT